MTTYVLDTNIMSLLLRNHETVRTRLSQVLASDETILGCPVVWFEVRRGLLAQDANRQIQGFERIFSAFVWQDFTRQDWTLAAIAWAERRSQGRPIADADLLIGIYARNRNAVLITDNEKDFVDLGVQIENWAVSST